MLKLMKILGGRTNVPEPIRVSLDGSLYPQAGALYYVYEDALNSFPDTETGNGFKIISLETMNDDNAKLDSLGYIVTPDMVFEADVYGTSTEIAAGDKISFYTTNAGDVIGVTADAGNDALVIDTTALRYNKVLITIL